MSRHSPAAVRRWQATLIIVVFMVAVAGAAVAGWWYARESSPHPGPIVLVAVDGPVPAGRQSADGGNDATPSIDALTADAVVFDRAYTHSPLTLPANASLLSGQLPFEHGIRDDSGFTLDENVRSLAALLRNRGFETGAAVSSFLLRPESGIAQGFTFFDSQLTDVPPGEAPTVERDAAETTSAATAWMSARRGDRYFLFVQVDDAGADATVGRLVAELKERGLYDQATIVLTADRNSTDAGSLLGEASLHVPLLVKQPDLEGAGRRVEVPVQHIDVVPTILDLVRAPIPSGLRGRSLRAILGDDTDTLPDPLIYAEALGGQLRLGTAGQYALFDSQHWYTRGAREDLVALDPEPAVNQADEGDVLTRMRTALDRLVEGRGLIAPPRIAEPDEDRFTALGYLGGTPFISGRPVMLTPEEESIAGQMHRSAALLLAQGKYAEALDQLRGITRAHPDLTIVQYQTGSLLVRAGRLPEAERAFRALGERDPDNPYVALALADVLLRTGREDDASTQLSLAIALAEHHDGRARAAAHQLAALVALAGGDDEGAIEHAAAVERNDPKLPMTAYVAGRQAHAAGRYEDALASFEKASQSLVQNQRAFEGVNWYVGDTFVRLDRAADAEKAFRDELRAFPRHIAAYTSLAMLYHASNRPDAVKETADALVTAVPTPEGYDAAARLWVGVGDSASAAALRTSARTRFRGDPSLALLQRKR